MRKFVLIFAALAVTLSASAQQLAFQAGEELVYKISYQATLWPKTDMGYVTLSVNGGEVNGQKAYRISARATTNKFFNAFYRLDDSFETWISRQSLLPLRFACEKRESNYRFSSSYTYDWGKMEVATQWRNHKRTETSKATLPLNKTSMDPMAQYYTLRSKDIASWELGYEYVIDVIMDDKIKTVKYRYLGEEKKDIAYFGRVSTLKLACQLANPDEMMDGGTEFYVWLSNDKNKIPLLIESPTKIGNVKVRLYSYKGLKYPQESVIK